MIARSQKSHTHTRSSSTGRLIYGDRKKHATAAAATSDEQKKKKKKNAYLLLRRRVRKTGRAAHWRSV